MWRWLCAQYGCKGLLSCCIQSNHGIGSLEISIITFLYRMYCSKPLMPRSTPVPDFTLRCWTMSGYTTTTRREGLRPMESGNGKSPGSYKGGPGSDGEPEDQGLRTVQCVQTVRSESTTMKGPK